MEKKKHQPAASKKIPSSEVLVVKAMFSFSNATLEDFALAVARERRRSFGVNWLQASISA